MAEKITNTDVGIDCETGEVAAIHNYNDGTKSDIFVFHVTPIRGDKDIDKIPTMFQEIRLKLTGMLGYGKYYCPKSGNKLSNKFYECGKEVGFTNFSFAGDFDRFVHQTAILSTNSKVKINDIILIVYAELYYVWWQDRPQVSRLFRTKEEAKTWISQTNAKIVFFDENSNVDAKFFKNLLPECRTYEFKTQSNALCTLSYARIKAEDISLYVTDKQTQKATFENDPHKTKMTEAYLEKLLKSIEINPSSRYDETDCWFLIKAEKLNEHNNDIIGIDVGSSRCCAAVNRKNVMTTVALDNTGERLLPSYVSYDEKHEKVGKIVVNRLQHYQTSTVFDIGKIIGKDINSIEFDAEWPFKILKEKKRVFIEVKKYDGTSYFVAEQIAAALLQHIRKQCEEFQGKKLTKVVLTHPYDFDYEQKKTVLFTAKLAGWDMTILLPEPMAAIFAYFPNHIFAPSKENIVLFDLGGTTMKYYIIRTCGKRFRVKEYQITSEISGKAFENILFKYFERILRKKYNISIDNNKKYRLQQDCQNIKETLTVSKSAFISVDDYDLNQDDFISINQNEFEEISKPILNKMRDMLNSVYTFLMEPRIVWRRRCQRRQRHRRQYYQKCQIDFTKLCHVHKVLLVGGGSRMPMIKKHLKEIFPNAEHYCAAHPDEMIAIGAAHYATYNFSRPLATYGEDIEAMCEPATEMFKHLY